MRITQKKLDELCRKTNKPSTKISSPEDFGRAMESIKRTAAVKDSLTAGLPETWGQLATPKEIAEIEAEMQANPCKPRLTKENLEWICEQAKKPHIKMTSKELRERAAVIYNLFGMRLTDDQVALVLNATHAEFEEKVAAMKWDGSESPNPLDAITNVGVVDDIEIEFPFALPSMNAELRSHWTKQAKETRIVRQAIARRIRALSFKPITYRVDVHWTVYTKGNRDSGSIHHKPATDGIVDAGLIQEDDQRFVRTVSGTAVQSKSEKKEGRTVLKLRAVL